MERDAAMDPRALIRDVPDFPVPGILFRDITPLLGNGAAFQGAIDWLVSLYGAGEIDAVVGIESRGFIFACPLADRLGVGFVPVRKVGKLPGARHTASHDLEYGSSVLEIHQDALQPGQRAVIVDDLLATGGTAAAAARLVERTGADVQGMAFLVELAALEGRAKLGPYRIDTQTRY